MNGTQIVSASDFINVPPSWTIIGTGDFNGDGETDILWRNANGDVAIWLMNGTQVISAVDLGNVPASLTIAETGDFNGDGKTDILWRGPTGRRRDLVHERHADPFRSRSRQCAHELDDPRRQRRLMRQRNRHAVDATLAGPRAMRSRQYVRPVLAFARRNVAPRRSPASSSSTRKAAAQGYGCESGNRRKPKGSAWLRTPTCGRAPPRR